MPEIPASRLQPPNVPILPQTQVAIDTTMGRIVIELFTQQAPNTVANILAYVESGFYEGTIIHVAEAGEGIIGGAYTEDLTAKETNDPISDESNNGLQNLRARVALHEPGGLGSGTGTSRILINLSDNPTFDFNMETGTRGYTVFGRVVEGMEVADAIGAVETGELTAQDGTQLSDLPTQPIVITAVIVVGDPVADAGDDQTVEVGTAVALDATGSAPSKPADTISYQWAQTAGSTVTLDDPASATPQFVTDQTGTLVFELTVTSGTGRSDTDTVTITVNPEDVYAPDADAGPDRTVGAGTTVTLDGTGSSDPDGDPLSYLWTGPAGITLDDPASSQPTFTAPATLGSLIFTLTVSDGTGRSSSDVVMITVSDPPTADAGADQTVLINSTVTLDATGSSGALPDDTLTYSWDAPASITLSDPTSAQPTFDASVTPETLTFTLTVTDQRGGTATDTVGISILDNLPPVAIADGDETATPGDTATLDGSASSDPEGGPLSYAWTQTAGENVTLSDARSATPTFTAPDWSGTLTFELTVTDEKNGTDSQSVDILISNPPVIVTSDRSAIAGETIVLDASESYDPDDDVLAYWWWEQEGAATVVIEDRSTSQATITVPDTTEPLLFEVTVTDDRGASDSATVTITVIPSDFTTTASGLQYRDNYTGTGDTVTPTSKIRCLYTGRLNDENGDIFDSSTDPDNPAEFSLSNLILGWQEGLGQYNMREDGKRILIIPPDLAYGDQERQGIPANSTLYFEVEVLDIVE